MTVTGRTRNPMRSQWCACHVPTGTGVPIPVKLYVALLGSREAECSCPALTLIAGCVKVLEARAAAGGHLFGQVLEPVAVKANIRIKPLRLDSKPVCGAGVSDETLLGASQHDIRRPG